MRDHLLLGKLLDLTDAFASQLENLTRLGKSQRLLLGRAVAQLQNQPLSRQELKIE